MIVTSGATEAIAASLLALISPGDEVVLFQPLYDAYLPLVLRAGGVPRLVRLAPPDWRMTEAALAAAFTPNAPGSSSSTTRSTRPRAAFDEAELALARPVLRRPRRTGGLRRGLGASWCSTAVAHLPLIALPGMAERTVKIGSAGKIFSLTGWKVGWAVAAPELRRAVSAGAPVPDLHHAAQPAGGSRLRARQGRRLFHGDAGALRRSRATGWRARSRLVGYKVLPAEGTYFLNVDLTASGIGVDDMTFCTRAVEDCGVAAIPLSAFYAEAPVTNVVRLCFAKKPETIEKGVAGLAKARSLFG